MTEIYDLLEKASPLMLGLIVVVYFVKVFVEKKMDGMETRLTDVAKTSLDIKKDMRGAEREDLVGFRVALEKWEDFLQRCLANYTMQSASEADVKTISQTDSELFLNVKIEAVKASIYVQDEKLEVQLLATIGKIRALYYPLIYQTLPRLIESQMQLRLLDFKLKRFEASGGTDMAFAPTPQDLVLNQRVQAELTEQLRDFSDTVAKNYAPIAEQLVGLRITINRYIYRPIQHSAINRD